MEYAFQVYYVGKLIWWHLFYISQRTWILISWCKYNAGIGYIKMYMNSTCCLKYGTCGNNCNEFCACTEGQSCKKTAVVNTMVFFAIKKRTNLPTSTSLCLPSKVSSTVSCLWYIWLMFSIGNHRCHEQHSEGPNINCSIISLVYQLWCVFHELGVLPI